MSRFEHNFYLHFHINTFLDKKTLTYCFSFRAFDSPDTTVRQGRVLPQWLSLVPHQVKVTSQLKVRDIRYVVVHAPERLDRGDCVDLLQVGLVFSKC